MLNDNDTHVHSPLSAALQTLNAGSPCNSHAAEQPTQTPAGQADIWDRQRRNRRLIFAPGTAENYNSNTNELLRTPALLQFGL